MTRKKVSPGQMRAGSFGRPGSFAKRMTAYFLVFSILFGPSSAVLAEDTSAPAASASRSDFASRGDRIIASNGGSPGAADVGTPHTSAVTKGDDTEDAADNSGNPAFFESKSTREKGEATSFTAAATGESGTFQPAGQSTVKQVVPEPDPTTGALIYAYPLTIPPGRNGLAPDLKLTYNSQDAQRGNYVGDRWSLNIPSIERMNKTGTDKLYVDNYFSSSLGGELVQVAGSSYAPKVENGDFLKYEYDGASWMVTDKAGTVYKFGSGAANRQDDPGDTGDTVKVYRWMLAEVRDTNGNFVAYSYYKDGGQIYPDTITYTGNGSSNGIFKITFVRGDYDSDSPSLYYPSFKVKTGYRITSITATVNDAWVRKYDLGYSTGDQGYRPLLASITASGRDLDTNTVVVLPAATFSYKTHGTLGWNDQGSAWQMPEWFIDRTEATMVQIVDINGDSFPDVAYADAGADVSPERVHISNTLNGWNADDANWTLPVWIKNTIGFKDNGTRIFDVNGDLLPDVVRSFSGSSGDPSPSASSVYLNSGDPATGWVPSSITAPIGFVFGRGLYADDAVRTVDVNGDGLTDIIRSYLDDDSGVLNQKVYLSNGSGWTEAPAGIWQVPFPIIDENPDGKEVYTFAQIADVNGDGLPDILWRFSDNFYWWPDRSTPANYTFINNGHGWEPNDPELRRVPVAFEAEQYIGIGRTDLGTRSTDLNGDGIPDILHSLGTSTVDSYAYLNTGRENTFPYNSLNPAYAPLAIAGSDTSTNSRVQLADVNADGLDDFLYSERRRTDDVSAKRTSLAKPNSFTDLLINVTVPSGGKYAITYKLSNQYRNADTSLMNPRLPLVLPTVQQITATDPVRSVVSTSAWSYQDGLYFYSSPTDRRFAGFGMIAETDPAGNVTKTYYHQGNATNSAQGEYADDPSKIGKIYRVERYDGAGHLYELKVNKWDKLDLGQGRSFVRLTRATTLAYDGNGTHRDTATEYAYDDTNGNPSQKADWGEVSANPDGSFTDTGSDKSVESISYAANIPGHVLGLPAMDTVLDQSGTKVRETRTYYDNLSIGAVGAGHPTKTENWVAGSTYAVAQHAYDGSYGLMVSATDPCGKVTTYAYDAYSLYPAVVTDPLGHSTQYLYDYASGQPKQVTDQNGFVHQTTFDGLGRVVTQLQPDLTTPTTLVTKTAFAYTDTAGAVRVKRTDYLSGSNSADLYQYFDGFGRLIQERKEAEASGTFNVKDVVYNNLGLKQKESLPYTGSGTGRTTATATAALYLTYAYDPLGRPLSVGNILGATTYAYDDWKTTVTDPNGKVKRYYKDAFGHLVKVDEVNGASTYVTTYAWNLNGNLTKITDALGNIRNFGYDGLGRRLLAEDLRAPSDSTYGIWHFGFDDAGNIVQSVNPNGQTVNYGYNDAGQELSEDYTGAPGTEIAYTYGGCTNGTGKLCAVTMTSGANTSYTYDSNGNIASETKTIGGAAFKTSYTYDRQGHVLVITYPDNGQARYSFNTAGLLEKIERKESGGAFVNVVSNFDYSPLDAPVTIAYANGITTTNTYDPAKLYRLSTILTAGAAGAPGPSTTSTFYSDPGTGGPTGSAALERGTPISGEPWGALRAGVGTYVSSVESPNNFAGAFSGIEANQWRALDRGVFTFDTSSIPDTDVILSATLSIYGSTKSDEGVAIAPDINVYDATPSTNYGFTAADFGLIGATALSTAISYAGWSTTGYNDFALNASGLASISKSGITRLGTRNANYDVANVVPAWSGDTSHFITGYLAQEVGTDRDPKLVVVHATAPAPVPTLQNMTFTYDAVGNITKIIDASNTMAAKTAVYTYDDLYRLTSAAITNVASGANYTDLYSYSALGNILSGPAGTYLYQGNTNFVYANPHAVTSINGVAYSYDRDGNFLSDVTLTNTWNYKDQLVQTVAPLATVSYSYDHNGDRVRYTAGAVSTSYPSKLYSTDGTKKTKQIYAGERLVATIETAGSVVTPYYVHTDQLGSTSAVSDGTGAVAQALDYYPFGGQRISSGAYNERRQYIGQVYDADTRLNYLNARYYHSGLGRFLSEDPVHLGLGDESQLMRLAGQNMESYLSDPQQLNSYSYSMNSPISRRDESGRFSIATGSVEKGDNLKKIRDVINNTYGTSYSIGDLARLNQISNPDKIFIGQKIIPNYDYPDVTNDLNQKMRDDVKDAKIANPLYFKGKMERGGDWDLKDQSGIYCTNQGCGGQEHSGYVFRGEKIPYDAPGNIHYGYVGAKAWYGSSWVLHYFADRAQDVDNGTKGGDTQSDRNYINYGIDLFGSDNKK
jgi:RHS repeat-associated protein